MKRTEIDAYFKRVQTELGSSLEEAESLLGEIKVANKEAADNRREGSDVLSGINKKYQQVVELISKIQTDLATVSELRSRALDPQTGLEAVVKKLTTLSNKAGDIDAEIEEIRKSVNSSQGDIKKLLESAVEDRQQISTNAKSADEILGQISEIYQLATDTGLAGSFDKRKKELEPAVSRWRTSFTRSLFLLGLVLAVVSVVTFFTDGIRLDGLTLVRFGLLTPLAVYVGFSALQYSRERTLLEKYAFKATTALALDSYTRLLVKSFDNEKHDSKVLDFVLLAMRDIYKEPHETKKNSRITLLGDSKLASLKAEIQEEFEKIDTKMNNIEDNIQSADTKPKKTPPK